MTKLIKGLFKVSLAITLFLFLLFFMIAGAIQVPFVQNYLVDRTTEYATELTGFTISIEAIHIDWFDVIVLEEAELRDKNNSRMIYLGEAEVDYTVLSLLLGRIHLDNITLRDGEVNLIRYVKDDGLNIETFIFKIQELTEPKVKRVGPPVPVEIPKFTLDNMLFSYNDRREELSKEDYFDHNHFTIDSIHGIVTDFYAVRDTILLTTHQLRANLQKSPLFVHELNTTFLLDKHQLECKNLYAKIGESELRDYFQFRYNDISELSDFNEKAKITIQLKESTVSVKDLAHFAPALKGISDKIRVSGKMKGIVNRFSVDNFNAFFGEVGHLKGKLFFDGLPNISETFMDIDLKEINVVANDLIQYTGTSSNSFLNKFGTMTGKGEFTGVINDFAVKGSFKTGLGNITSDVNLKISENKRITPTYKGAITTHDFNLGKLLGMDFVQNIDIINGEIEGKGFTLEDADFTLIANISRFGLYRYEYKNIKTEARFAKKFFDGSIMVNDSNIVLNATGKINLNENLEEFDIVGKIENAKLEKLNLIDTITHVSTEFNIDFKGTEIDSMSGRVQLTNTRLVSSDKDMNIKSLFLSLDKNGEERLIDFRSEIADASMKGNFRITEFISDLEVFYKEFKLFYDQDKSQIENYYLQKPTFVRRKYVNEFSFNLKNINNFISLYYPGLYIAQNTAMNGEFASGKTSRLNFYSTIDTLIYKGNELYKNTIDLSISKLVDSSDVLASCYVTSAIQNYKNSFKTNMFSFEGEWSEDKIDFATSINQSMNTNRLSLNGFITIKEHYKQIVFENSYLTILDEHWGIADSNSINFNKEDIVFNYFQLFNKNQSITIIGDISSVEDKNAFVVINNFGLKNLNPILNYKLDGVLDGQFKVRNIYKNLDLNGNIKVEKFGVDDFYFGDIEGAADWNETQQQLNVSVDLTRDNFKAIKIIGNIKPATDERREEIDLVASFNSADLGFISPILRGVMSSISGSVSGNINISGSINNIRLKGEAVVENGKFKLDYLGSTYTFNDKIYFTEDQIRFKNMFLIDKNGNKAKINGGISYDGFRNFLIDLKGEYKNFNVLNTTEKDNSLFYGKAFVTGDFNLFGSFNDMEIRANAKSEKETRIYIPLTGDNDVSQKEFIRFISKKKIDNGKSKDSTSSFRIRMFFNMEITQEAYSEIIFDKRSGDIIRGRGEGNIELRYDSRGDMTMFGNYTFKEGYYNFTMAGIVSKEFVIDKGSRMSWNGDPYEGVLDIKAKYTQNVSLKPLFADSATRAKPDLQRSYPTDVLLSVKGNLSSPEISMDIDILRYPSDPQLSAVVTDFESKIKTNDQELNRQVFSLIMLRSFTSISSGNTVSGVSSSSVGTSTVSELLSGQLSHYLSQMDRNLEINVNLKSMDKDALNTFNLRFSYTMLAGRLRISRNGSFQNVQSTSQASVSNIAGEWTVEYLLSQDGKLRIKLFNRINNNALVSSTSTSATSAGTSIMHVQSFNTLKELFRKKNKKEPEKETLVIPDDSSSILNPIDTIRPR
ncbi:MAG TPA: translocation/assembly module TamB domain-containing protein [Cytophagaceae bacterium]|nr:translocation/assembly module TamB domain-containing protein [Cytophagaceae bacterium]